MARGPKDPRIGPARRGQTDDTESVSSAGVSPSPFPSGAALPLRLVEVGVPFDTPSIRPQRVAPSHQHILAVGQVGRGLVGHHLVHQRPQPLDRLQFRRRRWQQDQIDPVRHDQRPGGVPASPVADQDGPVRRIDPLVAGEVAQRQASASPPAHRPSSGRRPRGPTSPRSRWSRRRARTARREPAARASAPGSGRRGRAPRVTGARGR